tara:strand:+ start:2077 stop:2181 length:105 start_codon:yes stop_codon:yes gene_type:complete
MKFFIKKLLSNESGYSGDIHNQRGKFIATIMKFL